MFKLKQLHAKEKETNLTMQSNLWIKKHEMDKSSIETRLMINRNLNTNAKRNLYQRAKSRKYFHSVLQNKID